MKKLINRCVNGTYLELQKMDFPQLDNIFHLALLYIIYKNGHEILVTHKLVVFGLILIQV